MRISKAIGLVLEEQLAFEHVTNAREAVNNVLNTMRTYREFEEDGRRAVHGSYVMEQFPDPEYPDQVPAHIAYEMVIDWYRRPISLAAYIEARMLDELGDPHDDMDNDETFGVGLACGAEAGINAYAKLMKEGGPILRWIDVTGWGGRIYRLYTDDIGTAKFPADVWSQALKETDVAAEFDADAINADEDI